MRVKLRVLQGSNAGRELKIPVSQFLIGREEGCHLRPRSDLISRKHCVIRIDKSGVIVRDLKSRNGTFVTDEQIEGDQELKLGDRLRVGKVEFEVLIDHGLSGTKKPKVENVKEAAARTVEKKVEKASTGAEEDITDWLAEGDEVDRAQRATDPDTRQYKLDETERVTLAKAEAADKTDEKTDASSTDTTDTMSGAANEDTTVIPPKTKKSKKSKREFGKLPDRPSSSTENSRDAAAQVLKDFFNRR